MNAIETLSQCMKEAISKSLKTIPYDRTSIGVVKTVNESSYTVNAFGKEYNISSSLTLHVGQKIAVTAPQNNFNKLFISVYF